MTDAGDTSHDASPTPPPGDEPSPTPVRRRRGWLVLGAIALFGVGVLVGLAVADDETENGEQPAAGPADAAGTDTADDTGDIADAAAGDQGVARSIPDPEPPETSGEDFVESFDTPSAVDRFEIEVHHRSDDDPGVDYPDKPNSKLLGAWVGDHAAIGDHGECSAPTEQREFTPQDRSESVYFCDVSAISGSVDGNHLMTSVGQVDGYSTVAFSPKQVFSTVSEVCWDQNVTDLGGRQWTEVVITPDIEHGGMRNNDGEYHLAHSGPGTIGVDEHGARHVDGTFAVKFNNQYDGFRAFYNDVDIYHDPYYSFDEQEGFLSRAIRRQHCITDNGDGTVTATVDQGDQGESGSWTTTVDGSFPTDARVIFEDHNYTPDKDGEACREHDGLTGCRYTWHWDNITVLA